MKTVSSTEIKNRLGQYMEAAANEHVVVEKAGRPVAVMLSYSEYQRLMRLEESYWAARVRLAEDSGFASAQESMDALKGATRAEA